MTNYIIFMGSIVFSCLVIVPLGAEARPIYGGVGGPASGACVLPGSGAGAAGAGVTPVPGVGAGGVGGPASGAGVLPGAGAGGAGIGR